MQLTCNAVTAGCSEIHVRVQSLPANPGLVSVSAQAHTSSGMPPPLE